MPYPYKNNPLNEYLKNQRGAYLLLQEKRDSLEDESRSIPDRKKSKSEYRLIEHYLTLLKADQISTIAPRTEDIFITKLDQARLEFEANNPKPKRPLTCFHEQTQVRLKRHTNNTLHVVEQCCTCNRTVKDLKKKDFPDWKSLPSQIESIGTQEEKESSKWHAKLESIVHAYQGKIREAYNFDATEFRKKYESKNPPPAGGPDCLHSHTLETLRTYSPHNIAVVLQCKTCGKHLKSISKKNVQDINSLPPFNHDLEKEHNEQVSKWFAEYCAAYEDAREKYKKQIRKEPPKESLDINNYLTYQCYYESPEWNKTRNRILKRDNYKCCACEEKAEQVHHLLYDRLGKENDIDLISLCEKCHQEVHDRQDSYKTEYRLTPIEIAFLWEEDESKLGDEYIEY